MSQNFADRLLEAIAAKGAPVAIAIDPVYSRLPAEINEHRSLNDALDSEAALDAVLEYSRRVIRIVAPLVPAVKINIAFFERYYSEGVEGYYELVQEAAERGLIVIGDVKRGDIGSTGEMYARAHLAEPDFADLENMVAPDAVTVSGYFGIDGVKPFIDVAVASLEGKGLFVLVRTSNESAAGIQDLPLADGRKVHEMMAAHVARYAEESGLTGQRGYSSVGAVVSTRDPETAAKLRAMMPHSIFLVPGYGAQGMTAEHVAPLFKSDGAGALVVAGRSVIFAYEDMKYMEMYPSEWEKCVEHACKDMIKDVSKVVKIGG